MLLPVVLLSTLIFCGTNADGDVLVYTDANFETEAAKHDVMLIEFYAPWCGHCKRLAPEYEKAATALKKADPPVALAKVDCTVETSTCQKFGVTGYPTLKIFKNGEFSKAYDGPREKDGIVRKMMKESGPISKKLESVEDAKNFLSKDSAAVIGFFEDDSSALAKALNRAADQLADIRFGHTTDAAVKAEYKQENDAIVLFRPKVMQNKFEDNQVVIDETNANKIKARVQSEAFGLCGVRTGDNAGDFEKPVFVAYYTVDYEKNPKGTQYWRNRVMKVGKKLRDEGENIYLAISDLNEMSREVGECGITDTSGDKPVVCAFDKQNRKYKMEAAFGMDTFEQFVRDVQAGKVEAYMKSEPLPEGNDEPGKVKVLVARNFNEIVNDGTKDVLVEFYAPWCGHCKKLTPIYDELAMKLKDDDNIVIAKMDATANDVPAPYKVKGFPTIFFASMDNKDNPETYNGGRTVDEFVSYLKKKSTNGLKLKKKKKSKKDEL